MFFEIGFFYLKTSLFRFSQVQIAQQPKGHLKLFPKAFNQRCAVFPNDLNDFEYCLLVYSQPNIANAKYSLMLICNGPILVKVNNRLDKETSDKQMTMIDSFYTVYCTVSVMSEL